MILTGTTSAQRLKTGGNGGFSLVEVVVFLSLVVISVVSLGYRSFSVHALQRAEAEQSKATAALENVIEQLRQNVPPGIDSDPSWGETLTAAYGTGAVPGNQFDIAGLKPCSGQAAVGSVLVVTDETLTDLALGIELGLPLDFNGAGDCLDTDTAKGATLLPVIVRARWSGSFGDRELQRGLLLMGR